MQLKAQYFCLLTIGGLKLYLQNTIVTISVCKQPVLRKLNNNIEPHNNKGNWLLYFVRALCKPFSENNLFTLCGPNINYFNYILVYSLSVGKKQDKLAL